MSDFDAFEIKMRAAGMGDAAVAVFKRNFEALLRDETGMISEPSSNSMTSGILPYPMGIPQICSTSADVR